jgi:hypothetical protein
MSPMWLPGAQGWRVDDAREAPHRSSWRNASNGNDPWQDCRAHRGMVTELPQALLSPTWIPWSTTVLRSIAPPMRPVPSALCLWPSICQTGSLRGILSWQPSKKTWESLGSHPRSLSKDGGSSTPPRARDEHDESDDHDVPDASHASGGAERSRCRTEL